MPPKGKADTAAYQQLKKELSTGNLGNLYLAKAKNAYNTAIKTGGNKEKLNANIELLNKLLGE